MNVELLREIAVVIQERPAEFDMNHFTGLTQCGTTHCIGGWARVLSHDEAPRVALDISDAEADRLFYVDGWSDEEGNEIGGWPVQFRGVEDAWKPTIAQAVARIEWFIETEGRE